ncbi:MAG: histidine--tRNA ligase [Chloroflexi bacterium]|nr:histidine--tRNA ligase [Chloroflexota bacterium]
MTFRAPRGTADLLPDEQPYWKLVDSAALLTAQAFGYRRIDTPLFEDTRLFQRGVGEDTDIVEKEMYTFADRGGDSLTLKPEGTAGVCRAYIENGMPNLPQPVRLFYLTPIFRYDRPQAGRYRQHHQFGIEAIGDPSPAVDAEVIELGWSFVTGLGLKRLAIKVNSIGDRVCRPAYRESLKRYFAEHIDEMCRDCKARLPRNPLRLLDCKNETCQRFGDQAPRSVDYLCEPCSSHWKELLEYLDDLQGIYPGIKPQLDHRLVRGLDYYTRTVFEIQPPDEGGQSTLLGGGRYDGLIEQLGGPPTPGIGFGCGRERLILNLKRQEISSGPPSATDLVAVFVGDRARRKAYSLVAALRAARCTSVMAPPSRSLKGQMRYADSVGARYVLIVGERELDRGVGTLKSLKDQTQIEVSLDPSAIASAVRATS